MSTPAPEEDVWASTALSMAVCGWSTELIARHLQLPKPEVRRLIRVAMARA